jgi:hypothetical protein
MTFFEQASGTCEADIAKAKDCNFHSHAPAVCDFAAIVENLHRLRNRKKMNVPSMTNFDHVCIGHMTFSKYPTKGFF